MLDGLGEKVRILKASSVQVAENDAYDTTECPDGCASVFITFSEDKQLRAEYWRIIKYESPLIINFDDIKCRVFQRL